MLVSSLPTEKVSNSVFDTLLSFMTVSVAVLLFWLSFRVNLSHFTRRAAPTVARVLLIHVLDLLILVMVHVLA